MSRLVPVYLAGPEVFRPDAAAVAAAKQEICRAHGLLGVHPLDAERELAGDVGSGSSVDRGPERALALYDALVAQLDRCEAGLADLTPFRGPSADVGTAWEVGYLVGRGRPVVAYTGEPAHYAQRVVPDGWHVEDHDLADNLMLEGAVRRSSGVPVLRVVAGSATPLGSLDGFRQAAAALAEALGTR